MERLCASLNSSGTSTVLPVLLSDSLFYLDYGNPFLFQEYMVWHMTQAMWAGDSALARPPALSAPFCCYAYLWSASTVLWGGYFWTSIVFGHDRRPRGFICVSQSALSLVATSASIAVTWFSPLGHETILTRRTAFAERLSLLCLVVSHLTVAVRTSLAHWYFWPLACGTKVCSVTNCGIHHFMCLQMERACRST